MENKNQETREERLRFAFGSHSRSELLFVTSDDQMFTEEANAKMHAVNLEDKEVQTAKRSDYIKPAQVKENPEDIKKKEREELFVQHEELFGNLPKFNASTKAVREKIEAEKARILESSKKDTQAAGADSDPNPTERNDADGGKGPEGGKGSEVVKGTEDKKEN